MDLAIEQKTAREIATRSLEIMETGTLADFEEFVHPDAFNREQIDEPPESRGRGPATYYATALWLRDAFADLRWELHDVVAEGDLIAFHCTMSGRHVRPFVAYDENAEVDEVFPPTGREFATLQSHWLRIVDGKLYEHWANRDDLGTAKQLGWVPPTPRYLVRMALAKRRARRRPARLVALALAVGFGGVPVDDASAASGVAQAGPHRDDNGRPASDGLDSRYRAS